MHKPTLLISISRDILMMNRVEKPVLPRNLFMLACRYGQIISCTKMPGQAYKNLSGRISLPLCFSNSRP